MRLTHRSLGRRKTQPTIGNTQALGCHWGTVAVASSDRVTSEMSLKKPARKAGLLTSGGGAYAAASFSFFSARTFNHTVAGLTSNQRERVVAEALLSATVRAEGDCAYRSKTRGNSSGAMPTPLSRKVTTSSGGVESCSGVLDGVPQKIRDHLRQSGRISKDRHGIRRQCCAKLVLASLDLVAHSGHSVLHDVAQQCGQAALTACRDAPVKRRAGH